jgi:carbamoyl-phosphate synthase large subunit
MKKKVHLLITCAGGPGPQYQAEKLRKKYHIVLADANPSAVRNLNNLPLATLPFGNDSSYEKTMRALVRKWNITHLLPGADEELLPVARVCADTGVIAIMPSADFIAHCLNKKALMISLDQKNISHVAPFSSIGAMKYPAIAKPISSRGSRGVHVLQNREQLQGYLHLYGKTFDEILVQPFVAGDEYTVSVIVNNRNELIGIVPKKVLLKRGITKAAVTAHSPAIERVCKQIVKQYYPCGPCNVQLKLWKGAVYVFEINPRLSTTSVLTDKAFGNEVELFARFYDAPVVRPPRMKSGVYLFRYDEHVFR